MRFKSVAPILIGVDLTGSQLEAPVNHQVGGEHQCEKSLPLVNTWIYGQNKIQNKTLLGFIGIGIMRTK